MLVITVPLSESYNEATGEFLIEGIEVELEHSLASLSKWEEHYEKPFLSREEKTTEETLFYIHRCMPLVKNPPGKIPQEFSKANYDEIQNYINAKKSATWFADQKNRPPSRQVITSEVIYGWLVELGIPFEAQYWHLNRLFTLVKVCNEQRKPPRKMGRGEAARQQAAINAQRQKQFGTKG